MVEDFWLLEVTSTDRDWPREKSWIESVKLDRNDCVSRAHLCACRHTRLAFAASIVKLNEELAGSVSELYSCGKGVGEGEAVTEGSGEWCRKEQEGKVGEIKDQSLIISYQIRWCEVGLGKRGRSFGSHRKNHTRAVPITPPVDAGTPCSNGFPSTGLPQAMTIVLASSIPQEAEMAV